LRSRSQGVRFRVRGLLEFRVQGSGYRFQDAEVGVRLKVQGFARCLLRHPGRFGRRGVQETFGVQETWVQETFALYAGGGQTQNFFFFFITFEPRDE
jgi:hypothetical protein